MRSGVLMTTRPGFNIAAALRAGRDRRPVAQEHMHFLGYGEEVAAHKRETYPSLDALAVLTDDDLRQYRKELPGGDECASRGSATRCRRYPAERRRSRRRR